MPIISVCEHVYAFVDRSRCDAIALPIRVCVHLYIFRRSTIFEIFYSYSVVVPTAILAVGWLIVTRVIMSRDKFSIASPAISQTMRDA